MATISTFQDYPFLKMLTGMPVQSVNIIYKSVPSVLFTMNMLDQGAKDLIAYMMTLQALDVDNMIPQKSILKIRELVKLLREIKIVHVHDNLISLCPSFRQSFILAMAQKQRNASKLQRLKEGKEKLKKVSVVDLFQKGSDRWDLVLKYLTLGGNASVAVSNHTITMFSELQFIKRYDNGTAEITSKGFQFLLQGRHSQIWQYLSAFLARLAKTNLEQIPEIIDLFCSLVMLAPTVPENYSVSSFSLKAVTDNRNEIPYKLPTFQHEIVEEFFMHMRELGFIYIRKRKDGYFYITPNLSLLNFSGSTNIDNVVAVANADGYLVVESNYRVYAYTNDELQLSILNIFTEPDSAFSDMAMAMITRSSVRRALELGITASQIVAFMRSNSHPITTEKFGNIGCVPQTVVDQIQLWEMERYRFTTSPGVIYSDFRSRNEFLMAVEQAKKSDSLLWSSSDGKALIISEGGHEDFKQWYATIKSRQNIGFR